MREIAELESSTPLVPGIIITFLRCKVALAIRVGSIWFPIGWNRR